MNTLAKRFLDAPMSKWDALVRKYNANDQDDMQALHVAIVELEQLAVHTARLAAYLRRRYMVSFHKDQDAAHLTAVEMQNKASAHVRKALGYTSGENIRF